jgi:hypothetical protein
MHKLTPIMLFVLTLAAAQASLAAELRIGPNDTIQAVIAAQKGKRVTVRVRSGQELTGTVRDVSGRLVHLGAISGREFFDAVVPLESIDAVLVRTKE